MADTEKSGKPKRKSVVQEIEVSGKSSVRDIIGNVGQDLVHGNKIVISIGGGTVLIVGILLLIIFGDGVPVVLPATPTPISPSPTPLAFAPAQKGESLIILAPYTGKLKQAEVFPERFVRDRLQQRIQSLNLTGNTIRMEQWGQPVSNANQARSIGQDYHATLVVWGEFDDVGGIHTIIEILQNVPSPEVEQVGEWLPFSSYQPQQQSIDSVLRECLMVDNPSQADYLVLTSLGLVTLANSDYQNAERLLTDAISAVADTSKCPTDARGAYYWRGLTRSLEERYSDAVTDFNNAVTLDKRSRASFGERGMARFVLGDTAGAYSDMRAALDLTGTSDLLGQTVALGNLGLVYEFQGELKLANDFYQRAFDIAKQRNDVNGEATNLGRLGNLALRQGNLDAALDRYQKGLALYTSINSNRGEAAMVGNIGLVYELRGELDSALEWYQRSLATNKSISYRQGEAIDLLHFGGVYQRQGKLDSALDFYQQALDACQKIGYQLCQAVGLGNIGLVFYLKGDATSAISYYQAALSIDQKINYEYGIAKQLTNIGLATSQFDLGAAQEKYRQALALCQQIGSPDCQARAFVGLGDIASKQGDKSSALDNLKQAFSLFESLGLSSEAATVRDTINQLER